MKVEKTVRAAVGFGKYLTKNLDWKIHHKFTAGRLFNLSFFIGNESAMKWTLKLAGKPLGEMKLTDPPLLWKAEGKRLLYVWDPFFFFGWGATIMQIYGSTKQSVHLRTALQHRFLCLLALSMLGKFFWDLPDQVRRTLSDALGAKMLQMHLNQKLKIERLICFLLTERAEI